MTTAPSQQTEQDPTSVDLTHDIQIINAADALAGGHSFDFATSDSDADYGHQRGAVPAVLSGIPIEGTDINV